MTTSEIHSGLAMAGLSIRQALRPSCPQAARAWTLLEGSRFQEAEELLRAAVESSLSDCAWKRLMQGIVALERGRLSEAERRLHESASFAHLAETTDESEEEKEAAHRLVSLAWHYLGRVFRRQERPDDARSAHLAAWRLRESLGDEADRWATALELGIDADVAGEWDEAECWFLKAVAIGEGVKEGGPRLVAETHLRLTAMRVSAGRFESAVSAAEEASALWRRLDAGSLDAAQADARLGEALRRFGEWLLDRHDGRAADLLCRARQQLARAQELLLPFGPSGAESARACAEQLALLSCLLESAPREGTTTSVS